MIKIAGAGLAIVLAVLAGTFGSRFFGSSHTRLSDLPRGVTAAIAPSLPAAPAHVVVVIEENKEFDDIAGNTRAAPYLNELIAHGALFTKSYGVAHPSQPNYTALFAGVPDTNGDHCPPAGIDANAPNLATGLRAAHRTFAGYSEDLPRAGSRVCRAGQYARKHVPWADFDNVLPSENLPLSALPAPYDRLPTVSFIIPNLLDDMHSASIARGDAWLRTHVGPIIDWAMKHDALVILTWDESDDAIGNHIPTIFIGPMVKPGRYDEPVTHYRVLRTVEDLYGLSHAGLSANAQPITGVWLRAQ
ncbi:MAG TPA: alkaline phosphatase family protein [Candidatus Baltobacteraceae bacterium]|nr:alkaline phosphatase family protein [Candidatus Baltobacteraceae bacterium]